MQAKKTVSFAKFYVLLSKMNGVSKEDLVWQYSGFLTTSLREFRLQNPARYEKMITDMQNTIEEMNSKGEDTVELKRLRSAILLRIQKHGIDTTNWNCVNSFMKQKRIAGKTLGEMSVKELKAFIRKMESILKKDAIKRRKIERIAYLN